MTFPLQNSDKVDLQTTQEILHIFISHLFYSFYSRQMINMHVLIFFRSATFPGVV